MIDTDKYEGHTPAPWFYYDDGGLSDYIRLYHTPFMDSDNDDTEEDLAQIHYDENCIADARLMADSPLLLAEVKRLQDALKEAVEVVKEMEGMAYAGADTDKFANHALEFIGNVKELIE